MFRKRQILTSVGNSDGYSGRRARETSFKGTRQDMRNSIAEYSKGNTYVMDSLLPSKEGGFYWLEDPFSIIPCDGFRNAGAWEAGLLCTWMYKGGGFQEYGGGIWTRRDKKWWVWALHGGTREKSLLGPHGKETLLQENICWWIYRQCLMGYVIHPFLHCTSPPSVKNTVV